MRLPAAPFAALLLYSAAVAPARARVDISAAADDLAAPAATVGAAVDLAGERLVGDHGALGWALGLGGTVVPSDGTIAGSASVSLDLAGTAGGWTAVGRVSGAAEAGSADGIGPLAAVVGASFVRDGETAGVELEPCLAFQWLVEPFTDLSLGARLTFLAGSAVVEPGLTAAFRRDATTEVRVAPALGVSWYPGIPLAVDAGLCWTGRVSEGGLASTWAATLGLAGAVGGAVLVTASGRLGLDADGWSVGADAEVALVLGTLGGAEVSLPLAASLAAAPASTATFGVGGGLRLSW